MYTNKKINYIIIPALLLICFTLVSCGSGSGSGSGTGSVQSGDTLQTGSVAVLLTDSPTDEFSEINITVTRIELLSDTAKVAVFSGSRILNLLDLRNETALFSMENNVPAGWYEKIRLTVTDVKLIRKDGQPVTKPVKLPGNGKIDLNPRSPFHVAPGEMLIIQLDIDAEKSLKLDENKNKYIFRPVVFIDVISSVPPEKLVRTKGIVRDIDLVGNTFRLCPDRNDEESYSGAEGNDDGECCVTVYVSDETSFFSAFLHGEGIRFEDLEEGSSAAVIGFYYAGTADEHEDASCGMGLDAVVVQAGDFIKLTGVIQSPVDPVTMRFDFLVDPDQEVESAAPITIQIQQGTKIYSGTGNALDQSAISENRRAEIDGKLLLDPDPDVLNASFISIDMDDVAPDTLSGSINNINYSLRTFDLVTVSDTVCIETDDDTEIFLIYGNAMLTSNMISFSELADGNNVDVYGSYNVVTGCLSADTVIAFDAE